MAENTKIQWCHHTFNPWRGCTRVSEGCRNCYAETLSKRNPKTLGVWGVTGTRVVASESYWKQPLKWNREAEAAGERRRVFCASLADVGEDRPDLIAPRARLCQLILDTQWLDWMLLTKRIENMARLFPAEVLKRCWIGATCENQPAFDERWPVLRDTPARIRFLSCEPMLERISFDFGNPPDLIIFGGESGGKNARRCGVDWIRDGIRQCRAAGASPFVKQLGELWYDLESHEAVRGAVVVPVDVPWTWHKRTKDKYGELEQMPADLRVREFPA